MAREKKPVYIVQMTEGKRNRECEKLSVNPVAAGYSFGRRIERD